MTRDETIELLRRTRALVDRDDDGSALPSLRISKVLQYAPYNRSLCFEIVRHFLELDIHVVIAVDVESIPAAVEVGRQLEARAIHATCDGDSGCQLPLGFELHDGERALLISAVIERNTQLEPAIMLVQGAGARLVGVGSIVDLRDRERVQFARDVAALRWSDLPGS